MQVILQGGREPPSFMLYSDPNPEMSLASVIGPELRPTRLEQALLKLPLDPAWPYLCELCLAGEDRELALLENQPDTPGT